MLAKASAPYHLSIASAPIASAGDLTATPKEALLSVPPPRWLDEQTEIPSEEYNSYDYQLTAPVYSYYLLYLFSI